MDYLFALEDSEKNPGIVTVSYTFCQTWFRQVLTFLALNNHCIQCYKICLFFFLNCILETVLSTFKSGDRMKHPTLLNYAMLPNSVIAATVSFSSQIQTELKTVIVNEHVCL